jgi:hypothetical protein
MWVGYMSEYIIYKGTNGIVGQSTIPVPVCPDLLSSSSSSTSSIILSRSSYSTNSSSS